MNHTQVPLRIADDLDRMDCIGIYDVDDNLVCELRNPDNSEEANRMRANAAYIVRAVNIHEALVTSIEELLDDIDEGIRDELGTGGVSGATLVRARQSLAQAKGE